MSVTIITPWINHPELIATYEPSVKGANVIIVDNGSEAECSEQVRQMVERLGGKYIRNDSNLGFSAANNQGLAAAGAGTIVFMNNDIKAPACWLEMVEKDMEAGALCGPSLRVREIDGIGVGYLEGYCLAAYREVWDALQGWDEENYPGIYWEDNDICFRAQCMGIKLKETRWPVQHFSNYTNRTLPGAYDNAERNSAMFHQRVRAWRTETQYR